MRNVETVEMAYDLDTRIASHISRGNMSALKIIKEFHMEEVRQIRDFMLSLVYDLNNPRELNFVFNRAIVELGINISDLLVPGIKLVSEKEDTIRLAV